MDHEAAGYGPLILYKIHVFCTFMNWMIIFLPEKKKKKKKKNKKITKKK